MKRINLLPQEERVKASRERGLIYAILILVVVVAAIGVVYVKLHSEVASKQNEYAAAQAKTAAEQQQVALLSPYAQLQAQRVAMTATAKAIYDSSVPFSTLMQELSLVIPDNVRLTTLSANVPSTMLPGAASVAPPASGTSDVTFSGNTDSQTDVATFMTRLGLIPQLQGITLSSSTQTKTNTSSYMTYTVTAGLRPYTTKPPSSQLQAVAP